MSKDKTDIEKIKDIFLAEDIDSEDYSQNLEDIKLWENDLFENENLLSWQEHDVTKSLVKKARESYQDLSMKLILKRDLLKNERRIVYAKQDAMLWLIGLATGEPAIAIQQINDDIKKVLKTMQ